MEALKLVLVWIAIIAAIVIYGIAVMVLGATVAEFYIYEKENDLAGIATLAIAFGLIVAPVIAAIYYI